ncbi:MAG: sugar phosphate isomerase/epimerase [Clostridiaceae bacterium]|nr:sugar phosphate isomerase/epimerase [Clostridiaceae bacterium]
MKKNQIAAQGYTIRELCKTPESTDIAFGRVKAAGYDAIQLSGQWHIGVDTLAELTKKHGLEVCATHIGFQEMVDDLPGVIENHKKLGCKYVGIGGMPLEARESPEACRAFVKKFNEIGLRLRDAGQVAIYHNHNFEFASFGEESLMDILFEEGDPDSWQFELDTHWVVRGFNDPVKWIRKVGSRMECVHFKDLHNYKDGPTFAEIGEGVLNWPDIIAACRSIGVKWYIVEQDTCPGDPVDSLAISHRNMLRMI